MSPSRANFIYGSKHDFENSGSKHDFEVQYILYTSSKRAKLQSITNATKYNFALSSP